MKIALNEKKKILLPGNKMTSGLFSLSRWILSASLAEHCCDATASIKLFFPQSQLLMLNNVKCLPRNEEKEMSLFLTIALKNPNRQQAGVIHSYH